MSKKPTPIIRLLAYLVPALLIGVASWQQYLVRAHNLTPWKGGGFGMFSTNEGPGTRLLRAAITTSDGTFDVDIPSNLSRLARLAQAMPTEERLLALASAMARQQWTRAPASGPVMDVYGPRTVPEPRLTALSKPLNGALAPVQVLDVRIDRYQLEFLSESNAIEVTLAGSVRLSDWR